MTSKLGAFLDEFGIDPQALVSRGLRVYEETDTLVLAETAPDGRQHYLTPQAAQSWQAMQHHASDCGIVLSIISAFRSVDCQAGIVRRKRDIGSDIEEILSVCAPPGYSEHHTGRAVDIGTPGTPPLAADFDQTPAFAWLTLNAGHFGFRLSYPESNAQGYCYEPWHWCHCGAEKNPSDIITTRPASEEDREFIFATYKSTMKGYVDWAWGWDEDRQQAGFWNHLPPSGFRVIVVSKSRVGAIHLSPDESGQSDHLGMMIIAPQWQRKGIGSAMLAKIIENARASGKALSLRVIKNNPAKRLYDRLGFAVTGEDEETWTMRFLGKT